MSKMTKDKFLDLKETIEHIFTKRREGCDIVELADTFAGFKETYPMLFDMIANNAEDAVRPRLNYMLQMMSQVLNDTLSQYDASVKVGQNLANEYVMPHVSKKDAKKD